MRAKSSRFFRFRLEEQACERRGNRGTRAEHVYEDHFFFHQIPIEALEATSTIQQVHVAQSITE